MKKQRIYSKNTKEAVKLLGERIKLKRKQHHWTTEALAERAGISRATLQKIEKGEMSAATGLVFEVASLVGVNLFEQDKIPLSKQLQDSQATIALLPRRIRTKKEIIDDDF